MSPCLYHESMSIPSVHVGIRSLILYHELMSIPRVFCQIHASISIPYPCFHFYTMRNTVFRHRNTNNNKRNTNVRITEIKFADLQKFSNTVKQKFKIPD